MSETSNDDSKPLENSGKLLEGPSRSMSNPMSEKAHLKISHEIIFFNWEDYCSDKSSRMFPVTSEYLLFNVLPNKYLGSVTIFFCGGIHKSVSVTTRHCDLNFCDLADPGWKRPSSKLPFLNSWPSFEQEWKTNIHVKNKVIYPVYCQTSISHRGFFNPLLLGDFLWNNISSDNSKNRW